jgi:GWxTD domain-containing protein
MRKAWVASAAAGLVMAAAPAGRQGGEQPLTVSAVRFYSPAAATTTIEGVCELRLAAVASGPVQVVRYQVEVAVRDSTGLELQRQSWSREVAVGVARAPGATAVETFSFPAAAGRYLVVVRVVPETGPALERAVGVSAFAGRPALSDVLLGDSVWVSLDTGAVGAGEVRRGSVVMRTAPVPGLSPARTSLSYYAEVYPWQGATLDGELSVAVLRSGGVSVVRTAPRAVRLSQAGGVTEGSLDLAGLPPGRYNLQLRLRLGDSTVTGQAPFVMAAPAAPAEAETAATASPADPFDGASEARLDSLYAPMVYLLEASEQRVYGQLSVDGKRRFLREAWAKRDPDHGAGAGGVNQAMARFYASVDYVNRAFREGGAGQVPGWRTDRGRVFLRNGRWDDILRRPMASPAPYEAWKYTRGRQRWYVFLDRSGMGVYQLIATNDRREVGLQNWGEMLGSAEDSTDVMRFLGLASQGEQ